MKIYGFTWIFFIFVGLFLLWLATGGPDDSQLSPPPRPFLENPMLLDQYNPDRPVDPLLKYEEPVFEDDPFRI